MRIFIVACALVLMAEAGCASSSGASCTQSAQCAVAEGCVQGHCQVIACIVDTDCRPGCGMQCVDGRCEQRDAGCGGATDANVDAFVPPHDAGQDAGHDACAIEACNGRDDDCDGMIDEGATICMLTHASATCTTGACVITTCDPGFGDCDGMVTTGCEMALGGAAPTVSGMAGGTGFQYFTAVRGMGSTIEFDVTNLSTMRTDRLTLSAGVTATGSFTACPSGMTCTTPWIHGVTGAGGTLTFTGGSAGTMGTITLHGATVSGSFTAQPICTTTPCEAGFLSTFAATGTSTITVTDNPLTGTAMSGTLTLAPGCH